MDIEQVKILIKNKAWDYTWGVNNLDHLNESSKERMRGKIDALFDLLIEIERQ